MLLVCRKCSVNTGGPYETPVYRITGKMGLKMKSPSHVEGKGQ